jgi:hypothetical protein
MRLLHHYRANVRNRDFSNVLRVPMITGRRSSFEARCRERGYTLDEVRPCIVSQDGDRITVDVDHPAYPRRRKPGVSLLTKARNFAASTAAHVAAGMPQASEEEVARRFAICETCEHFDGKACRQCGCAVVRERKFLSKLSWANEKCPVDKWGPEAEKQPPD